MYELLAAVALLLFPVASPKPAVHSVGDLTTLVQNMAASSGGELEGDSTDCAVLKSCQEVMVVTAAPMTL